MDQNTETILEYSKKILEGKIEYSFVDSFRKEISARCIEVPWTASQIKKYDFKSILDIGISMASLDYLGVLLELGKNYDKKLEAVDIIRPERVKDRYPAEWLKEIDSIPLVIGDIRDIVLPQSKYDAVTCISVIEHVGFDMPSINDPNTAFLRTKRNDRLALTRPVDTNKKVLDKLNHVLKDNGILLLTVPMGKGGPVILKDSLGFYCVQWEYEELSWKQIVGYSGFSVIEQHFFKLTDDGIWIQVREVKDLQNQKATPNSHSNGCAIVALKKISQ